MKKFFAFVAAFVAPVIAFAQAPGTVYLSSDATGISGLVAKFANLLQSLFPILVGLAVAALFYEIVRFIFNREDPEKKKAAIIGIGWSVFAIVIMLGFMGFIEIVANTLGVGGALGEGIDANEIPTVQLI